MRQKFIVVQYRERSNKNFENTRGVCVWLFMTKKESETISIVIENLMFQKCAEAPTKRHSQSRVQKSSPVKE